jgi:hypothetical protein
MAGAAGGSAGSTHEPDDAVDPRPCCDDSDAAREETRSYVERGRALKDLGDEELVNIWVAMVERWFRQRSPQNQRDMGDAAAELRLRDIEVPEERLGSLMDEIREENQRDKRRLDDETKQQMLAFIGKRKGPFN